MAFLEQIALDDKEMIHMDTSPLGEPAGDLPDPAEAKNVDEQADEAVPSDSTEEQIPDDPSDDGDADDPSITRGTD